ncbi:hypothetical protein V1294_005037 [Bradyrhizobium sp. AZCC 1678]|uniref:hypothetical protein n=1 Tax=Bradyrhizobium sp. AZCC 1678 TaxID=3117030 RepID=UPI002FF20782
MAAISPKKPRSKANSQITDSDLQHHSQELGRLGSIFGSKEQAPIYFAGLLMVVASVGFCIVAVCPTTPEKSDALKALGGIIIAALTFLGGASGRTKD